MKFFHKVYFIFLARLREFYRDRASLSWNLFFPFFIIFCFYFIFSNDDSPIYKVGVLGSLGTSVSKPPGAEKEFFQLKYIQFLENETKEGIKKVKNHKLDMLLELGEPLKYWVNASNKNGYFLEKLIQGFYRQNQLEKQIIKGRKISYIDWVFPGIIALNLMFSCLWGVGWIIVKYRDDGYLKRLNATPLKAHHFLLGQMFSRFVIVACVTSMIYILGSWIIDFEMQGSYLSLIVCYFFGALSLISIGLLAATRTTSKEFADGLLNMFSWPMIIFSGMWFSIEGAGFWVKALSYSLPLTHLIEATRKIMLEGADLSQVWVNVASMALFAAVFFLIISFLFKWNEK